ncbi:psbQ-like protein 3, chloroplastic [Ipomoea triloba]|uniref:psbQ-like protein 3, chloroplastic n=1 Tax=Ipomoea triloba TaxID=35885 RepID=UPI00125E47B4|nr:psbQ-like protein 3, chloroplastic [Ipomoea triloba]
MALQSLAHKLLQPLHISPTFTKPSTIQARRKNPIVSSLHIKTRRAIALTIAASTPLLFLLSRREAIAGFDLRLTEPEQTLEEALSTIEDHAKSLLQVKELLEEDESSWREAQRALRNRSALLKQDIYTIIQGKPGTERPLLRKMYSTLFNSVSRLDYAARDKDVTRVWESYDNIVMALDDILPKLLPSKS